VKAKALPIVRATDRAKSACGASRNADPHLYYRLVPQERQAEMTCHNCRTKCQKFGKDRKGNQRFRCCQCYKVYADRPEKLDGT
jgi:protein-arginine kinase activator protein McsA